MAGRLPKDKSTFEIVSDRAVDFLVPPQFQIPVRLYTHLGNELYNHLMFLQDAKKVFHAIKPVLSLLSLIGAPPIRMRCNPPGPVPPFQMDFSLSRDVIPDLSDYSATVQPKFDLVEAGAVEGFDLTFTAPAVSYYGAETALNWRDLVGEPTNNLDVTWVESFADEETGVCLMQFSPGDPDANPEGDLTDDFDGYVAFIARHAEIYVRAIADWMRQHGESVSDSYLYSD